MNGCEQTAPRPFPTLNLGRHPTYRALKAINCSSRCVPRRQFRFNVWPTGTAGDTAFCLCETHLQLCADRLLSFLSTNRNMPSVARCKGHATTPTASARHSLRTRTPPSQDRRQGYEEPQHAGLGMEGGGVGPVRVTGSNSSPVRLDGHSFGSLGRSH